MKLKNEAGQAMVEFALVVPILLLILGGIIDFGWVFHQKVLANNFSRETARYVSIHYNDVGFDQANPDEEAKDYIYDRLPKHIQDDMESDGDPVNNFIVTGPSGGKISVSMEWNTSTFMPFYSKFLNNIKIDATTVMKIE